MFRWVLTRDGTVRRHEEIHREVNPGEFTTLDWQIPTHRCAGCHDDRVIPLVQLSPRHVDSDSDSGSKSRSLVAHLLNSAVDVTLLHFEIRNSVSEQPADTFVALVDSDGVSNPSELLRSGKARGTGANDGDCFPGQSIGQHGVDVSLFPGGIDDREFRLFDGYGRLVDAQHAGGFARRWAETSCELGEIVCCVKTFARSTPFVAVHQVVEFGDQITQWASLVAERDTTVHAPPCLAFNLSGFALGVDLFPISQSNRDRPTFGRLARRGLQESSGVNHWSPA